MEEILHQLIGSLSHYLQGFYIPVVQDFFHDVKTKQAHKTTWPYDIDTNLGIPFTPPPLIMEVENGSPQY